MDLVLLAAAFTLTGSAVREHKKLKTIAYAAAETSDSPEAARAAFFKMVDASNSPSQEINRVDSLPQARVRAVSPTHQHANFVQNPIPLVPETSQQSGDSAAPPDTLSYTRPPRKPSHFVPKDLQEAIDKKWEAKKAKADEKYLKKCTKLDNKYGKGSQDVPPNPATEAKYQERQGRLSAKHDKKKKTLELKHCTETSLTECKYRHKAEKEQRKGLSTENALPRLPEVHASTDGASEQYPPREREVIAPASSYNMAMMGSVGSGAAAIACMSPMFGGAVGGTGGC